MSKRRRSATAVSRTYADPDGKKEDHNANAPPTGLAKEPTLKDPHFRHLHRIHHVPRPGDLTERFREYNPNWAHQKRRYMTTTPEGTLLVVEKADPKTLADSIEMLTPLIRPYGCGPVTNADDFVLRTYDRILEVRSEIRFNESGQAIGDRTFKRCYQQALRDISLFTRASRSLQDAAIQAAGKPPPQFNGVPYVFTGAQEDRVAGGLFPEIRAARTGERPDGILRTPELTVMKAFELVVDKHWHRYLLPFGCFFTEKPTSSAPWWNDWSAGHTKVKNGEHLINPYSVTMADVLYLCNTVGYLERFAFIVGVILWAKCYGCNLLRFHRRPGGVHSDADFREYISLERYLHMFGALYMHRKVLESNKNDVGGNWAEMLDLLQGLETKCCQEFMVAKNSLYNDFDNMIVRQLKTAPTLLTQCFPKAGKVSDKRK